MKGSHLKLSSVVLRFFTWSSAVAENQNAIARVNYHVWYDPEPAGQNSIIKQLNVDIEGNSTFFAVMGEAAKLNEPFYRFEADEFPFGHYVTSIGGFKESPAQNMYWMIYKLSSGPNPNSPPSDDQLSDKGVDGIHVSDADIYLFWRRFVNFEK